ncbi:MAG: 30S ribosome-binding factor RbfA [Clostridia bacterium]|nr:30S ribosome-binding factor RbfA [Clostridia bacterium]
MENIRQQRANAELIKALSVIIRDRINDPRLKKEFITLTYTKISADFRHCKVGFDVLSGNKDLVNKLLKKCEGFIKRELLSMIKLPFAPELVFIADEGSDNSKRVSELLSKLDIPAPQESNDDEEI